MAVGPRGWAPERVGARVGRARRREVQPAPEAWVGREEQRQPVATPLDAFGGQGGGALLAPPAHHRPRACQTPQAPTCLYLEINSFYLFFFVFFVQGWGKEVGALGKRKTPLAYLFPLCFILGLAGAPP